MKRISGYIGIVLAVAVLALFTGCSKKVETKPAGPVPGITSIPGYYEDQNLGFSIEYMKELFSVPVDLKPGEVVSAAGSQQVPTIVVRVEDIQAGVALEDNGAALKKALKRLFPTSTRHKVVETKMIKLKGDIDANFTLMKWRYQGAIPVVSVIISTYKDGKEIRVLITSTPGAPTIDEMTAIAMALKVNP